jgi:hypothetical protein
MMLKAQLIWCVERGEGQNGGKQEADLSMKQSDEKILPAPDTCPTQKCMSLAHQQTYRIVRSSLPRHTYWLPCRPNGLAYWRPIELVRG